MEGSDLALFGWKLLKLKIITRIVEESRLEPMITRVRSGNISREVKFDHLDWGSAFHASSNLEEQELRF